MQPAADTITLSIDGPWEPADFVEVLTAVESLYYKIILDDLDIRRVRPMMRGRHDEAATAELDALNRRLLERARLIAPPESRIRVASIQYASPGGIDFAGIGRAMEAIDRIVGRLIALVTDRHLRRERDKQAALDTKMKEQTLLSQMIANAKEMIEFQRRYPETDISTLVALMVQDQQKLVDRIGQGLIMGSAQRSFSFNGD